MLHGGKAREACQLVCKRVARETHPRVADVRRVDVIRALLMPLTIQWQDPDPKVGLCVRRVVVSVNVATRACLPGRQDRPPADYQVHRLIHVLEGPFLELSQHRVVSPPPLEVLPGRDLEVVVTVTEERHVSFLEDAGGSASLFINGLRLAGIDALPFVADHRPKCPHELLPPKAELVGEDLLHLDDVTGHDLERLLWGDALRPVQERQAASSQRDAPRPRSIELKGEGWVQEGGACTQLTQ